MAQGIPIETSISRLRAICQRISSAQQSQLPYLIPHLPAQIAECKALLSSPQSLSSEATAAVYQFKTRISSLLQDRSIEGRWASVVLVKCAVEAGGWELLHQSSSWVRSMIGILNRPDPTTTKNLCIIAVTRIFILTHDHGNLVREITTPNLPPFLTACLNNSIVAQNGQLELLDPVLQSFSLLIPRHPTIFRPFISQIERLLVQISPVLSEDHAVSETSQIFSPSLSRLAQRVFIQLHSCASKGVAEKRDAALLQVIDSTQSVLHQILSVLSQKEASFARVQPNQIVKGSKLVPPSRLCELLSLIEDYILTPSSKSISVPLGRITTLLNELSSFPTLLVVPVLSNSQISKGERDRFLLEVPSVHVAAIHLLLAVLDRLGIAAVPLCDDFLYCCLGIYGLNTSNILVRSSIYTALKPLLAILGPTISKQTASSLQPIIRACCSDLLPLSSSSTLTTIIHTKNAPKSKSSINPNALIGTSRQATTSQSLSNTPLRTAAWALLPTFLRDIPSSRLNTLTRSEIDRTAILLRHRDAMEASLLCPPPPPASASILPIVARLDRESAVLDAILRPRMPVVRSGRATDVDDVDDAEETVEEMDFDHDQDRTSLEDEKTGVENTFIPHHPTTHPAVAAEPFNPPTLHSSEHGTATTLSSTESLPLPLPLPLSLNGSDLEMPAAPPHAERNNNLMPAKRPMLEPSPPLGSSKRARLTVAAAADDDSKIRTGPDARTGAASSPDVVPGVSTTSKGFGMNSDVRGYPDDNDSDDNSDFEVPPLVLGIGSDDDD